jgi:DNA helicase-2/ATP-dependent DNA helicase PcrA
MSIAADNPTEEIEEERRLCYVGITRARKELTLTAARMRMVRGENMFNNISRFVREIPPELIGRNNPVPPPPKVQQMPKDQSYIRAKQDFKAKTFDPSQFKVVKADSLDYKVGDRVSHIKFGEGTVLEIVDGGRDFEVKVDFDRAGVKRMFASFAKLKKIG